MVKFAIRLACACTLLLVPALAMAQTTTTALAVDSEKGDRVGQGMQGTWIDGELAFSSSSSSRSSIVIQADDFATFGSTSWFLRFASPDGADLVPGVYEYAGGLFSRSPRRAGIDVSGPRSCSPANGRFVIYEISFDTQARVTSLAADFEQHCGDTVPALFGAIRYRSTRADIVPFDGAYPVYGLQIGSSPFGNVSGSGFDCGNGGTICGSPYPSAVTVNLTATPAPGYTFLGWAGDCPGTSAALALVVSRRKLCSPIFDAVPGAGVAPALAGTNIFYVQQDASTFQPARSFVLRGQEAGITPSPFLTSPTVAFSMTAYDGQTWSFSFTPPQGQVVQAGTYERVGAIFRSPLMAGMDLSGGVFLCSQTLGRVVVYDVAFDSSQKVIRFAADFEQHCATSGVGATYGAIRYNAGPAKAIPFDGAYPKYSVTIDPPVNGSVTGSGISCSAAFAADCTETYGAPGPVTLIARPAPGHAFVAWTGDCTGSTNTQLTIFSQHTCGAVFDAAADATGAAADDLRLGSLTIFSQKGDRSGLGQRQTWTRRDTLFTASEMDFSNRSRGVRFTVQLPDGSTWRLTFGAPTGQSLRAGDFTGVVRSPFQNPSPPVLDVSSPRGSFCSEVSGRFRVYEVHFDAQGKVDALAADFEQHCDKDAPALFGAIRYNSNRASVIPFDGVFLPAPTLWIDTPTDGSSVRRPFSVSGWALNSGETTGTGIDTVHVYAWPAGGGAAIFLGEATYGGARADVGAIFGTQFRNCGFTLRAGDTLAPGTYLIAAYGRNTYTGAFDAVRTVTVTIPAPVSAPRVTIDLPSPSGVVVGAFTVAGWAIDTGAESGPGVDAVHVYAFKAGVSTPIFLGVASYGRTRGDIGALFGTQFTAAGYNLPVSALPSGAYTLAVYARSTITGQFSVATRNITVQSEAMSLETPVQGALVAPQFVVSGWAFDGAAASGNGVDVIHVWAFPASGAPSFLGVATVNGARPDVAATYGTRFGTSGFSLSTPALAPGQYTLAVYAHSLATNSFSQVRVITITVN